MLETKDLRKVYKPKKGVPVTALDGVSLAFPETGMVFLLGKSGSGKSTLLNLLGGLDRYDGGDILIDGVSTRRFNQQQFDSYRNTYVGFIFQEYNVLEEFSVGANIALAIELQGRKATDEEINAILREVDLEGFGNRKPNELSGGQKQRVAIARALIKNPRIVMADEPTGALDSSTGKQVFDTLKKLSANKLVIIVSHDREFAESYADRIIELADGKVVSDVEPDDAFADACEADSLIYEGDTVTIPSGYHLTEEDRERINLYIQNRNEPTVLKIASERSEHRFKPTVEKPAHSPSGSFKLIKSRLPMKSAFRIGASGLKYKKIRLTVTVLLSCVAFGLFGLADTFGSYNHIKTCAKSLRDTDINYVSVVKSVKYSDDDYTWWNTYGNTVSDEDISDFYNRTDIKLLGVKAPNSGSLYFGEQFNGEVKMTETNYNIYPSSFTGFAEINAEVLSDMKATLVAGRLPDGGKDEIAIDAFICETFKKAGYSADYKNFEPIADYSDMLGKTLVLNGTEYTVVGVVDTGLDFDRYSVLMKEKKYQTTAEELVEYALAMEFDYASRYSLAATVLVGEGFADRQPKDTFYQMKYSYLGFTSYDEALDCGVDISAEYVGGAAQLDSRDILWLDGEKKELAENEIVVSADAVNSFGNISYFSDEEGNTDYNALFERFKVFKVYGNLPYSGNIERGDIKIVGLDMTHDGKTAVFLCDKYYNEFVKAAEGYDFAVGAMPKQSGDITRMLEVSYDESGDSRLQLKNSVTFELDTVNEVLQLLSKVFLYIGIGFAVFAAIMLSNFIATSISYKKQDIGTLRAIGSRSNDVFRIFFSESFIIAFTNFLLTTAGLYIVTAVINNYFRYELGILVTVLNCTARQVLLLFALSMLVAFVACFLPIKRIASKRPIDAIRNR